MLARDRKHEFHLSRYANRAKRVPSAPRAKSATCNENLSIRASREAHPGMGWGFGLFRTGILVDAIYASSCDLGLDVAMRFSWRWHENCPAAKVAGNEMEAVSLSLPLHPDTLGVLTFLPC